MTTSQILTQKLAVAAHVQKTERGKHDYLIQFQNSGEEQMYYNQTNVSFFSNIQNIFQSTNFSYDQVTHSSYSSSDYQFSISLLTPIICQFNHTLLPYFVSVHLFQQWVQHCNVTANLNLKSRIKNTENNILSTSYKLKSSADQIFDLEKRKSTPSYSYAYHYYVVLQSTRITYYLRLSCLNCVFSSTVAPIL